MNNTDRKKLKRIYDCLKIPGCHLGAGTMSACVKGVAGYAKDAEFAINKTKELLYMVGNEEAWEGQFEETIVEFEKWHEKRKTEGWE